MPARTVYLETFGCQMNELDSELVTSRLRALGYAFTREQARADVVLYNTCSVREHAEQKVWSRLGELALRKREEPALVVGVLGCMAEREGPALVKRMPVVDVLVGPGELDQLPALLDNAVRTRTALAEDPPPALVHNQPVPLASAGQVALQGNTSRRSSTLAAAADTLELLDLSRAVDPDHVAASAYVRITRGCNKFCTYCVVPHTRGAEVHRPPQHIIDECKRLADAGVIEITLLGQTVNHYRFEHASAVTIGGLVQPQKGRVYKRGEHGGDAFAGERVTTFADLLHQIHEQVPALRRLRFVTSYPRSFGDDVLSVIRQSPRICRYLHVPAQTGSDRMLLAMNRGYTIAEYLEFVDRARAALHQPEIGRPLTLAGDIIVGFPGESDADVDATAALLERVRYKNCFIFKYSARPGTTAYERLPDDVPEDVKRARNARLLALQSRISGEVGREFVGMTMDVMVQGVSKRQAKRDARRPEHAHAARLAGGVSLTIGGRTSGTHGAAAADAHDHHRGCAGSACSTASQVLGAADDAPVQGVASDRGDPVQLSARTDGDLIVFFDCPPDRAPDDFAGTIKRVRIESSKDLGLFGTLV